MLKMGTVEELNCFGHESHRLVIESHTKKYGGDQKYLGSPVLRPLEGKAAAAWMGGAYEGVREHGQGATCLDEAAPAKAGNAAVSPFSQTQGRLFQYSHRESCVGPGRRKVEGIGLSGLS